MLTVGLMLAGCGSTGNHVRNQGVASTPGAGSRWLDCGRYDMRLPLTI